MGPPTINKSPTNADMAFNDTRHREGDKSVDDAITIYVMPHKTEIQRLLPNGIATRAVSAISQ
jgi:hypothetical protein